MTAEGPEPLGHTGVAGAHYYGGQAVLEGVMMRGADSWAVAARRPTGDIYLERQPVSDFPKRHPLFMRPMLRGVFALFDAMSIGVKALGISASQALTDEEGEHEEVGGAAIGVSMALAAVFFVAVFIFLPNALLGFLSDALGSGLLYHVVEGVVRIAIFLGYLSLISLLGDIRRVFQYHGAEHMT
ncbi:MAG: DUF1385 domain-containing protein, partial [Actinobacteria bacterium]|nr:DUF1385 domain-containing protein [Actinomycetota bacterium]